MLLLLMLRDGGRDSQTEQENLGIAFAHIILAFAYDEVEAVLVDLTSGQLFSS